MHRYGLYALQWIVEVNGKLTPDLETFVDVTKVRLLFFSQLRCHNLTEALINEGLRVAMIFI